ncbi:alkene reductase [Steroidobacter sp. S1-65]|uniref:Alkene reductase n=1 Tax=Steroidobacter gossypii TaxID=2805490 RepID=A0ABS1WV99_9GAMM|nr:alkene reductase [Steroidobacter gossypii]MBM0104899.1 alkene reductase [Steroidobacter gossypii]
MNLDPLFQPLQLGVLSLKHRVVMAPLTRLRSRKPGDVPTALNAEYYGQRASEGGLIITEATDISPQARGYRGAPGIYSCEQIAGWRLVTDAVHAKGGLIANQIWHTGRVSHSSLQPKAALPVAPSAIAAPAKVTAATGDLVMAEVPRELTLEEIQQIASDFVRAANHATAAGFDAVEVHGANGYLLDQFLQNGANQRRDAYGGSVQNRSRLLLEVIDAVSAAVGPGRVGVRLSPFGSAYGIFDTDGWALWEHIADQLGQRRLAYLHLVEPRAIWSSNSKAFDPNAPELTAKLKSSYGGQLITAGGYRGDTARAVIASGGADAVAFGRLFIANPDLPERLRHGAEFNSYDRSTFYGGGARGYIDYPFLASEKSQRAGAESAALFSSEIPDPST